MVVCASVSRDTSAMNPRGVSSATVRQTPATATLSPSWRRAASIPAASMLRRRSPPRDSTARTAPMQLTIPVNIAAPLLSRVRGPRNDTQVGTDELDRLVAQLHARAKIAQRGQFRQRLRIRPKQARCHIDDEFIDQS